MERVRIGGVGGLYIIRRAVLAQSSTRCVWLNVVMVDGMVDREKGPGSACQTKEDGGEI